MVWTGRRARACSRPSAASSSSRRSGTPLTNWLAPGRRRRSPSPPTGRSWSPRSPRSLFGLGGIGVAWTLYGAKTSPVPRTWQLLEQKFYWDEAYDLALLPAGRRARARLARYVERPLIAGSIGEVTRGFGFGSREVGRVQNGLVRSYALALASGVAVLAVVFLSAR